MTRALFHCAAIRFEGLLSCVVCARKLIIIAENSTFVGKLTARMASCKTNFLCTMRENEEVYVQSEKLLTVLQINRVYNFL